MKRLIYSVLVAALAVTISLSYPPNLFAKPVNMKAVIFLPTNHDLAIMVVDWVKRVNAELKDHVNVTLGGPEVIPGLQQADAVKDGVVDIAFSVTAYFTSLFPEGWAFFVSKYTPMEERKSGGFHEFMADRFKKINVMYLGRWLSATPFYLWTIKPVSRLEDLQGLKMRSGSHFDRFMKEMGMIPVTIMTPDVYTSLERGAVDGMGWPLWGPRESGWTDKCKYIIDHPFHDANNAVILMNLNVWNKLPKEAQSKLLSVTEAWEAELVNYYKKEFDKEWKKLEGIGVKPLRFPDKDAQKYLEIIDRVDWEILAEKVPELIPQIKKVTGH
jgi:TRAP-type C4-dicarboxylate transport system substrate-binding protein